ncbi:uncharacterized protein LOC112351659 [Selaginella moellendorffii]|uniref:uncharacterized protein LOC112351659 n=1 Tax=Selaginella moellendorffii TaxID=88036 RepID=UPI000D1CFE31|nr:uncharacterized protein LOC112351659 [Selaginella moellendorffii]|eukprot:XP_024545690.1 uncharacterized protein LOC112351659 [Selaginella moellendorffii]
MMRVLVGKSGVDLAGLEKSVGAPVAFLVRTWGRGMRGESKAGSSVLEERSNPAVAAIVNECKLRLSGGVPRRRLRGLAQQMDELCKASVGVCVATSGGATGPDCESSSAIFV